jgi:hypothetical protein
MNWIAGALLDGPVPFERRACMPKFTARLRTQLHLAGG